MKKIFLSALLGLATLTSHAADSAVTLNGAGATFPKPIYDKWAAAYGQADSSVKINYAGGGSSAGIKGITDGTVDFGASDAPMTDKQLADAKTKILHLPTVAGAVVVVYNLPGVTGLKLDGPTLANIYLKKITKWNDPAIAGQNAGMTLPSTDIVVVHRSDGSGTTSIFTDYLSSVSAQWKADVGKGTSVEWPAGVGQAGNAGVAGQVQKVTGAIGYVELIYALANKISYADMKNAAGKYVSASLDSVTAALSTATIPDDYRFSMVNAPGDTSYPIAGVTWLLVNQQQTDPAKGKALVNFIKWIYTTGQKSAADAGYAPLPEGVVTKVQATVNSIKY